MKSALFSEDCDSTPRSPERGPVEANRVSSSSAPLPPTPRSPERGPVEAPRSPAGRFGLKSLRALRSAAPLKRSSSGAVKIDADGTPRSPERGPVEAARI